MAALDRIESVHDDIAVIGASCRFSEIEDVSVFWHEILKGRVVHGKQPRSLGPLYSCDARRVMLPSDIVPGEDKVVYFAEQLIAKAFEDAGYNAGLLPSDRVGLFMGVSVILPSARVNLLQQTLVLEQTEALFRRMGLPEEIFEKLKVFWAETLPPFSFKTLEGAWAHTAAIRVAQTFGFAGPAGIYDAGAVSGFSALQAACDSLRTRRCDFALVVGIQPPFSPEVLKAFGHIMPLSTREQFLPFDKNSDGTVLGEGGVCLVLQRMRSAEENNTQIYGLVRGIGTMVSKIGRNGSASQVQNLADGLTRAFRRCCRKIETGMDAVDYYEANGSGIPEEDAAELKFLREVTSVRPVDLPPLAVSANRNLIGHTFAAAGLAGVLKALLAVRMKIIPPSAADEKEFQKSGPGLCSVQAARPWISGGGRVCPRRAATGGFDFTGAAACAILEVYPEVNRD